MINATPPGLAGDGITGIPARVRVGAAVGVTVPVEVTVAVGAGVNVSVTVGVIVEVLVSDDVCVTVAVLEAVVVCDGVGEGPMVGVSVTVGVEVRVAVLVGVVVFDGVTGTTALVKVGVLVAVEVAVAVTPALAVVVAERVIVSVAVVEVGPTVICPLDDWQEGTPSFSWQPSKTSGVALNVSGLTPLATPWKLIVNSVPIPLTAVVQASVIVTRPSTVRLTTGALHVLITEPACTDVAVTNLLSYVKLTAAASRLATVPIVMSTAVLCPGMAIMAVVGRLTCTADTAEAAPTRKVSAPMTV